MTEPPEPRHPEEGGGEEDYDAAWESADADEIMDGLEDDALMDSIRDGIRGDLTGDELADLLAGLRDEPDAIDIPVPNLARVKRGENVLPTRESEQPVSAQDEAARLRQLAGSTEMIANVQASIQSLEAMQGEIQGALGESHSQLSAALGPVQQAIAEANNLVGTIQAALSNLDTVAGQIG